MAPRRAPALFAAALAALSASAAWVAGPPAARAQSLTWVLDPALPPETLERIEGQTLDLPFARVSSVPTAAEAARHPVDGGDPLGRASWLAAGSGARVVIWTQTRDGALELTIVDLEARRVLVRAIPVSGADELSAALETVALIVRSALQALAEGGEIGVRHPPPEPPPEPAGSRDTGEAEVAEPIEAREARTQHATRPPPSEPMLGAGLVARALVRGALVPGGAFAFALRRGRLWLGAALGVSLRDGVRAPCATIRLNLASATLDLGVVALARRRFALVPVASLGVGRVRRETARVDAGLVRTGSRSHLDLRLGLGAVARVSLGDVAWLTLDARLELPLARVRYSLVEAAGPVVIARTPRVAPALGLGLAARVGRAR